MQRYNEIKFLSLFIFPGILLSCRTQEIPTVITSSVTAVTLVSATCGGTITDDGGSNINAKGVCWDVYVNPTISASRTNVSKDDNPFQSNMTGLAKGTTYHVRAYATNSVGTAYGNDISFTTLMTDASGNTYNSVIIGTQTWMVENLRTTLYNNFVPIHYISNTTEWADTKTDAYCYYNNDADLYKNKYGVLYNWNAVNKGRLCPVGWHVPTSEQWTILTDYLKNIGYGFGGSGDDTGKSMAASSDWNISITTGNIGNDQESNNSTGFTALPGGSRGYDGLFDNIGKYGYWWSSTQFDLSSAWQIYLYYDSSVAGRSISEKNNGFSVRCIKDY
jgi:uncharacterized protein (TIGR02145 family)